METRREAGLQAKGSGQRRGIKYDVTHEAWFKDAKAVIEESKSSVVVSRAHISLAGGFGLLVWLMVWRGIAVVWLTRLGVILEVIAGLLVTPYLLGGKRIVRSELLMRMRLLRLSAALSNYNAWILRYQATVHLYHAGKDRHIAARAATHLSELKRGELSFAWLRLRWLGIHNAINTIVFIGINLMLMLPLTALVKLLSLLAHRLEAWSSGLRLRDSLAWWGLACFLCGKALQLAATAVVIK